MPVSSFRFIQRKKRYSYEAGYSIKDITESTYTVRKLE